MKTSCLSTILIRTLLNLSSAGMIIDDLGEYLLLSRIQNDRADIANPYGFNKENATAQLEFLKTNVGEENFALC